MPPASPATYDDANLVMRLYNLRREEKLREARAWFVANFYASNREMLLVAVRFRPVVAEIRAAFKDPTFLKNLETVAQQFSDHLDKVSPGTLEAFVARVKG